MLKFLIAIFFLAATHGPNANAQGRYLFVLDLDRMLIEEQSEIPRGAERREYFRADGMLYQTAAYGPEFLSGLRFHFSKELNAPVDIAIFSAGHERRNRAVAERVFVSKSVTLSSWLTDIKSFKDLTPIRTFSLEPEANVPNEELWNRIQALGGQEGLPFFAHFTKDLTVFHRDLSRTIIFEDNINSVPLAQRKNVVVIARSDVVEELLPFADTESKEHWAKRVSREQAERARLRLVRAIGVLDLAAKLFTSGQYPTLPDALMALQWESTIGPTPQFRTHAVNHEQVYRAGLRILRDSYFKHVKPVEPAIPHDRDDFRWRALKRPCEALF